MLEVAVLLVRALVALFRPKRRDLVVENMVLRHQPQVALRTNPRPVLHHRDRILTPGLRGGLLPGVPGFVGTGARIPSESARAA